MKHLSSTLLAAALIAAGTTACFTDPTESAMNGPELVVLSRSAVTLRTGDSVDVLAEIKDGAGNVFDANDATWTSGNEAVAVARRDTTLIPGGAFSRVFIRATAAGGGVTTVTVNSRGVSGSIRVLVLPAGLSASAPATVSGTATTDTIAKTLPDGSIERDIFSVGDTVTFTVASGSNVYFTSSSQVNIGAVRAYVVARTDSTALKVIARIPFRGRPWVTALRFNGPAEVGVVDLDSLAGDTVLVARPRFYGTVSLTADTMVIDAPAGASFATTAGVRFGGSAGIVLTRSTSQLKVISPVNWTGVVNVTRVVVGSATVDSLKTPASYTIAKASFGGTVVTGGRLLDTVKVYGTAVTKFTATGSSASNVTIGGQTAWVLVRTADSMYVITKMPSTGPVAISNVNVGGTVIPTLNSAGNVVITETPTGETNEPANDTPGAVTITLDSTVTSDNPIVIYGAIDDHTEWDDFFAFTLTAARTVTLQLQFAGTGGGGASDPDIDLLVCNADCSAWVNTSGGTASQPENVTLNSQAAGTYNIYVSGYDTGGTTRSYKLIVY